MSGAAISRSTRPNSRSTSSALLASQAKALAPVLPQSSPSFSILRAASATLMPSRENSRASEALSPSPAPTIKAVLYFGCAIRALPIDQDWYLGAHPGEATHCCQDHVEIALAGHAGVLRAQHGERARVIFLRLLRPCVVAKPDRKFLRALGKRLFIGERPGPEQPADLFGQDRHQGWRQRSPAFERTFGLRPQHAVDPFQHMRRVALDQRTGGRVGPEFVELCPQDEIAIGRRAAAAIR